MKAYSENELLDIAERGYRLALKHKNEGFRPEPDQLRELLRDLLNHERDTDRIVDKGDPPTWLRKSGAI